VLGLLGFVAFSAIAGILATVAVAPAVALASIGTRSAIGIFDSIPEYFNLDELPERNEIYAHSSSGPIKIATIYDQNREEVSYDQISQYVLDATVAGEDRRFYEHGGIDPQGVMRAVFDNLASGGIESGASSLTQQLVKNTFVQEAYELPTEEERRAAYEAAVDTTFDRKIKEMKIAIGLEKQYTKKEILVGYLNVAFFGMQAYGIQAAAQRYFGVSAADLTLPQAASLIAIVQYPEQRNLGYPENFAANQERRDYILDMMALEGYITPEERDAAQAIPVDEEFVANGRPSEQGCRAANINTRFVCDYVIKSVKDFDFLGATEEERKANWARGGYKIYTTIDYDMQAIAQDLLWTWTPYDFDGFDLGSALSTVEPGTGRIRIMAQNKIFDDAAEPDNPAISTAVNFNTKLSYGSSTGKQPGSTYKLFTLLEWMNQGHGVNELVSADPAVIPASAWTDSCTGTGVDYQIANFAGERGVYTVTNGTWQSVNGVFLRMASKLDLCKINQLAAAMGVERADETPLQNNPASVLGSNEVAMLSMANAYATLAAVGKKCDTIIVDSYTDPQGNTHAGQTPKCSQVLDQDVALTAIQVLVGNSTNGTGSDSNPYDGVPFLSKTGTTDLAIDTAVATSTTTNATMVWVGNVVGQVGQGDYWVNGVSVQYVRHEIMRPLLAELNARYGGEEWPAPSGRYLTGANKTIPNVSGLGYTYEQGKAALEALGFVVVKDPGGYDSDQPKDTVAAQDPAAGTQAAVGQTVYLLLSKQNMTVIPNVVGQTYQQARNTLNGAKWPNNVISAAYVCDDGYTPPPPGSVNQGALNGLEVVAQAPGGNTLAITGGPVTLTVNLGTGHGCTPTPVDVPNVVGSSYSDAQHAIQSAGLQVGDVTLVCKTGSPTGGAHADGGDPVTAQSPSGGTASPGSSVDISVRIDQSKCS